MAGLTPTHPVPTEIRLHQVSRLFEVAFDDGARFKLPYEFMRVFTPSAEARGHGPGQETLQTGKREVSIDSLEAVGNYAVQPSFSDGHDTGIYSWDLLYRLGKEHDQLWAGYLQKLEAAGASREPAAKAATSSEAPGCKGGGCAR